MNTDYRNNNSNEMMDPNDRSLPDFSQPFEEDLDMVTDQYGDQQHYNLQQSVGNEMSTEIGSAFFQIQQLHPDLLAGDCHGYSMGEEAEGGPDSMYGEVRQDLEPDSPFQTLEPVGGHFQFGGSFDTRQSDPGLMSLSVKAEIAEVPSRLGFPNDQLLPTQASTMMVQNITTAGAPLPTSPSQWEDIKFSFDPKSTTTPAMGLSLAIKQEVPDTSANSSCALSGTGAGVGAGIGARSRNGDVKENLKATIKQRRASRGLAQVPSSYTGGLARSQLMKGMTPEEIMRKERRKEQNRRAAQKCREKKRRESKMKEKNFEQVITENRERKVEVERLRQEVSRLQRVLAEHETTCGVRLLAVNN